LGDADVSRSCTIGQIDNRDSVAPVLEVIIGDQPQIAGIPHGPPQIIPVPFGVLVIPALWKGDAFAIM